MSIKIETCRYGINRIPVNERLCESCESVEDEYHVLMQCPKYDDIRTVAFESICRITPCFTTNLSNEDQFIQIMSNPFVLQNCVKGYASHTQCTP